MGMRYVLKIGNTFLHFFQFFFAHCVIQYPNTRCNDITNVCSIEVSGWAIVGYCFGAAAGIGICVGAYFIWIKWDEYVLNLT